MDDVVDENIAINCDANTFYAKELTLENQWRAIILFGRNVASYKFALAQAFIHLNKTHKGDLIRLDELASPFSHALCEHLKENDKQGTSPYGRLLSFF